MTENHDYDTPEKGATDWHVPLNENFEQLDGDVEIRDEEANLSEYTPKPGAKFLATDTEAEYIGDGSEWQRLASSGKSPTFDRVETTELRHSTVDAGTRRKLLDTVDATDDDRIEYDTGELPVFDAYEVNFVVERSLSCQVNDVGRHDRYEYVMRRSGPMADHLDGENARPGFEREESSSWDVFGGRTVGAGTLIVHGSNVVHEDGTYYKTAATVTVTHSPDSRVLDAGTVKSDDPVRRLQFSGGSGKLNVYGVDYVR